VLLLAWQHLLLLLLLLLLAWQHLLLLLLLLLGSPVNSRQQQQQWHCRKGHSSRIKTSSRCRLCWLVAALSELVVAAGATAT
jgi:hypothetical protein